MSNLKQGEVYELLLASNKQLIKIVANHMYYKPHFVSKSCLNLLIFNISRVQLADDDLLMDDDLSEVAWKGRIYVSDVPKSWTQGSNELRLVYNMWVIDQIDRKSVV